MPPKSIETVLKETKISQILRPKLLAAQPGITIKEAIDTMRSQKAGYLVVADKKLKIRGVFTERDVLYKILPQHISLNEPIDKHLDASPTTLHTDDTIGDAIRLMKEQDIRHIPLVDDANKMVGVLSVRTIVNFLSELFPTEVFNLPPKADQIHETAEGG